MLNSEFQQPSKIQHSTLSSTRHQLLVTRHSGIAAFQNSKSSEASTLRLP
jgi:hypothetical protein